jgi:hypothetical protein
MYYINDYPIDPNLKYLVYFRGNFGPPTKGHFSLVEHLINYPNVKYFIHQIGRRHGFPYQTNRKIFQIYLNPYKDRIILEKIGPSLDVLNYIDDVDKVILIRGAESEEPLTKRSGKEMFRDLRERYRPLGQSLAKMKIKLDFLFVDRPLANVLSATKFTEALTLFYKTQKHISQLRRFIPDHVNEDDFHYIIKKLCKTKTY